MTPAPLPGVAGAPPPNAAPPTPSISGANVAALTAGGLALNVALKARGLVVVPLYARLLDPAGLGIVTLGTAIATLLAPFVHLGLPLGMLVELPHRPAGAPFTRGVRAVLGTVAALALLAVLVTPWGLRHGPWPSLAPLAPYGIVVAA